MRRVKSNWLELFGIELYTFIDDANMYGYRFNPYRHYNERLIDLQWGFRAWQFYYDRTWSPRPQFDIDMYKCKEYK